MTTPNTSTEINADPPEPIESDAENTAAPAPYDGPVIIEYGVDDQDEPFTSYMQLTDMSAPLLFELASMGNENAAQELAFRMENDPEFAADDDDDEPEDEERP